MHIITHLKNGIRIAELLSDVVLLHTADEGSQLLADTYYQGYDAIIIRAKQLTNDFFNLKTGLAGDVLQKFSNYRVRLAIIGDFKDVESESLRDFIYESNKGKLIAFVASLDEALSKF